MTPRPFKQYGHRAFAEFTEGDSIEAAFNKMTEAACVRLESVA